MPALVLLVLLAAAPARAADSYELKAGGERIGTEESTRTPGDDGMTLAGAVRVAFPGGGEGTLTQEARYAKDGKLSGYTLDIDAPGQQFVVKVVPSQAGYALTLTPRGSNTPLKSESVATTGPVVLLDNNFASHLDQFTRTLKDLGAGGTRAVTALVPQAMQAFPAKVERLADGTAQLDGMSVSTRTYALTIANIREEIVAAAADGALLHAAVPIQRFDISRKGFTPAKAVAPLPADPRESAVSVRSPVGSLPGAVTRPKTEGLAPAVLFISGSGPNDRDETVGPNKPFRDLAYGLTDRGIASLRVDKRTAVIKDPAAFANVTLAAEYYDDAAAALALLRATPGVDPNRIFVLGHSEGAMVAPKIAATDGKLRGVILMAPAVRPIDVVLIDQQRLGAKLTGRSDAEIAERTRDLEATFAKIRDSKRTDTPPFLGAPASYWREILAVDVAGGVAALKIPVLVLQGDKDYQVRKDLDFDVLKAKAGTAGGRITYRSFPKLNHLFMPVEHESTGAEYGLPGHVDPAVISAIADWLLAR
jgi:alpha-beta hydrolase superfamily lysophospholipase